MLRMVAQPQHCEFANVFVWVFQVLRFCFVWWGGLGFVDGWRVWTVHGIPWGGKRGDEFLFELGDTLLLSFVLLLMLGKREKKEFVRSRK